MPTMSSSRVNPAETPVTAFAASARVKPWAAAYESLSLRILSVPLFCSARTPCGIGTLSLPFGPSTRSSSPTVIFTPEGTGKAFLPILDIAVNLRGRLPDLADQFTAHILLARDPARHKAARRRQHVDSDT